MKRTLLFLPVLAAPLLLFSCGKTVPTGEEASRTIQTQHEVFKAPAAAPAVVVPPAAPKRAGKHHRAKRKVVKAHEQPVAPKPPCLFDFIAPCIPQQAR